MRTIYLILIIAILPALVLGADYHIGPGQAYTTIGAFPWATTVVAGDTVYIHAKPDQTPYHERLYLSAALQGTELNPIRIIGVSDEFGNQPILDGNNSTTGQNFDTPDLLTQYYSTGGLLVIGRTATYGSFPQWIEVENLWVRDFTNVETYDENGLLWSDRSGSVVKINGGKHITLNNVTMTEGGDGLFAKNGSSPVEDIIVKNCNIYDNGVVGNYLYHNIYTEVTRITFENNTIGKTIAGSPGNAIKDRSSGTIIRYNFIDSDSGHFIDLIECQDLCEGRATGPEWEETYVYGNVMYTGEPGTTFMIHFGTESSSDTYARKNLFFYNNTMVLRRNQSTSYYATAFKISHSYQTVYAYNNIWSWDEYDVGGGIPQRILQYDGTQNNPAWGNMTFGVNWFTAGWTVTRSPYPTVGVVTGTENIISPAINDPHFVDPGNLDFHLANGSTAVGVAQSLPAIITSTNWTGEDLSPTKEYSPLGATVRVDLDDLGAFYSSGSAAETCSDGILNQNETATDCGGVCPACQTATTTRALYGPYRSIYGSGRNVR